MVIQLKMTNDIFNTYKCKVIYYIKNNQRNVSMKIRNLFNPLLWGLVLIFSGSCSENERDIPVHGDGIVLRLTPSGAISRESNVGIGTDAENKIENIAIWCYPDHAADATAPLYHEVITGVSATNEAVINLTEKTLGDANMTIDGTYDIYVAANLPSGVTLGNTSTPGDLKQYAYTTTARPASPFSMTGVVQGCDFSKGRETSITLTRNIVRFDISLINETSSSTWTINSVKIKNDQRTVLLFEPAVGTTLTSDAFTTSIEASGRTTDGVTTYSAYVYENRSDVSTVVEVEATIGADNKKYVAEITPDRSTELLRNSICKVTLRLQDEIITPKDVDVTIAKWVDAGIPNITIPASYLTLSSDVIDVVIGEGGSVGVESDAKTIHVDWKQAPGYYLDGYEDITEADLSNDTGYLLFKYKGDVNLVIPDGKVVISSGNLKKTVTLRKRVNNVQFSIQSIVINGQVITNGSTISGDLGGSTQKREAITITANTNIAWACTVEAYTVENVRVVNNSANVSYGGTPGISVPNKAIYIPTYTGDATFMLPVSVTITFFLNSYVEAGGGVQIGKFEFTIDN